MLNRKSLLATAIALAWAQTAPLYAAEQSIDPTATVQIQQSPAIRRVVEAIQADPENIKTHLINAGRADDYVNTLSGDDLERLVAAGEGDDDAVADIAEELIEQEPGKLISVHTEVIGKISLDQLNEIEAMIGELIEKGRLAIENDAVVYHPPSMLLRVAAGAAAVGGLAAAGGGGGGGDPTPAPWSVPNFPVTAQYNADYHHALIGTEQAHDRGYTGDGVIVAILDTGFMSTHNELTGQFVDFYNIYTGLNGAADAVDPHGHGTHVAGIIGAKLDGNAVTGVAPDAQLVGIRIGDDSGELLGTDAQVAAGINYAVAAGADFINNSWGANLTVTDVNAALVEILSPLQLQAYRDAAAADTVMVFATGNDAPTLTQPTIEAGLPYLFPDLKEYWVAVASVGADGIIASYSQPCGVAANWCMVAPGGDDADYIVSAYNDGGYMGMQGTSMATPVVTGALAVLKERFPTLTNDIIVDRLFLTANKSGIYADSAVYGQGLLDLNKATDPLGPLSVVDPTVSTLSGAPALPLSGTSISLSGAFGAGVRLAFANTPIAVADSQGAGFFVDMGSLVRVDDNRIDLEDALDRYREKATTHTQPLDRHSRLSFATRIEAGEQRFSTLIYGFNNGGQHYRLGQSLRIAGFTGSDLPDTFADTHSRAVFDLPYAGADSELRGLGWSSAQGAFRWGAAAVTTNPTAKAESDAHSTLGVVSLGYGDTAHAGVELMLGYAREQGGLLGAEFNGAFALSETTPTRFLGLQGGWQLSPATRINASAYWGFSRPAVTAQGLVSEVSHIASSSFALGLDHRIDPAQRLGLIVSQPLRVERGSADVVLSTGYEGNRFNREPRRVDLGAQARELDYELFYRWQGDTGASIKASLVHQVNPGHQRVADESLAMVTAKTAF